MAINKIGNNDFEQSAPETWFPDGWGLDRLIVPFRGSVENETSFLDSLVLWDTSTIDENMFLSNWSSDKHEHWPTVELVYIGKRGGNLPPTENESDDAVQSASSSRTSAGGILTSPATVQYYAPTNTISYISRGGPGGATAGAPSADIRLITYTVGDTTFSIGATIEGLIALLFTVQIISTLQSKEIVPGEYWQNVSRTTKVLTPFIFDVPSGPLVTLADPGNGYAAGDSLYVAAADGFATITVLSVGSVFGGGTGILSYSVGSPTFTLPHTLLAASGGSGSGAKFNVWIIP